VLEFTARWGGLDVVTETTDKSELIMPAILKHLIGHKSVQDALGRNPCKVFPGDVPQEVESTKIRPPWLNLERGDWQEEMTFSGGTGCFRCTTAIVVVHQTMQKASAVYAAVRKICDGKYSVTWGDKLWIGESQMNVGQQVPLLEADGSPSKWQQLVGELFLLCHVLD
jgi:hypothetical protein